MTMPVSSFGSTDLTKQRLGHLAAPQEQNTKAYS
jgi:hypothetical protein